MTKKWYSAKPTRCDICHDDFTNDDYFIDGRLEYGSHWAIMCSRCHDEWGTGLGTGKGQKYDWETLEKISG